MSRKQQKGPSSVRIRVDALKLKFAQVSDPARFQTDQELPQSLVTVIREAIWQCGAHINTARSLEHKFNSLIQWALRHDKSTEVAASFAVQHVFCSHAMNELAECHADYMYWDGMPWTHQGSATGRTAYTTQDLHRIRELPAKVRRLSETSQGTALQSNWTPQVWSAGHECDPLRPPLEAIVVAAQQAEPALRRQLGEKVGFESTRSEFTFEPTHGDVLAVGLGLTAGPQALSAMLPNAMIYSDASPYSGMPMKPRELKLLVVNVTGASAIEMARFHARERTSPLDFQKCCAFGEKNDPTTHVQSVIARLVPHFQPGLQIVVLAGPRLGRDVESAFNGTQRLRRILLSFAGGEHLSLSVSSDPYKKSLLGRAVGRVVTAWKCL